MSADRLETPFRVFKWSFILIILGIAGVYFTKDQVDSNGFMPIDNLASIAYLISGLSILICIGSFYISLGMLAKRLGKSWITWVGLTIITSPFGPVVAFIGMCSLVKKEPT